MKTVTVIENNEVSTHYFDDKFEFISYVELLLARKIEFIIC